jgi:hypothetical protein
VQDRIYSGDDAIACPGDDPSWKCAQQWILLAWFREQGVQLSGTTDVLM